MKLTLSSLKNCVDYPFDAFQLAEKLTLAGLETVVIPSALASFSGILVGNITEVTPHPNADRLSICQIDLGQAHTPKTIVCGAKNVRQNLKVATALIGTTLPNNLVIQSRAIRGITSEGMLCSLSELGLDAVFTQEAKEAGIWELSDEFSVGDDLWGQLGLGESVLDIQTPPNRGDCLSTLGMAREIAALYSLAFKSSSLPEINITTDATLAVEIADKAACPRYTGRIIQDIDPDAKTPWWMLKRLWQGGISSVNAVVDVTNYVLLEWGAPLHAFDVDQLSAPLTVRSAHTGEKLHLLIDKTVKITEETLVISDQKGPVAIAGIMGGEKSAVTTQTKNIFLESAYFAPEHIASKARHYGLMTESSYRFERGVDPKRCEKALIQATYLLLTICKGQAGPITHVENAYHLPEISEIPLKHSHIKQLLGIELPQTDILQGLERLGIKNKATPHPKNHAATPVDDITYQLRCPSWRFDLKEPVDLIEELARLSGYDQIPSEIPTLPICFQPVDEKREALLRWRGFLASQGFYEAINYSFTNSRHQKKLDPEKEPVALANPISNELDVLRTQLWPGLLSTLQHNYSHQHTSHSFFECGTVFIKKDDNIIEQTNLSGIITGAFLPEQWGAQEKDIDFFDVKQLVHNGLQLLDKKGHYTYTLEQHPALHPSESSVLLKNGKKIGWLGSLHPSLCTYFKLVPPVYLFEFQLQEGPHNHLSSFEPFSRFPSVRRDIAFWIDQTATFESIQGVIGKQAGPFLQTIRLFDVYSAKDNPSKRSLALGLIWQHSERTLTDSEVSIWQSDVIKALEAKWSIEWRSGSDNLI